MKDMGNETFVGLPTGAEDWFEQAFGLQAMYSARSIEQHRFGK